MNKIRTVTVDDEPLALDLLRSYLDELPIIEIVAECRNGREAIEATMTHQPDLMFLDIQMPGLNGFDLIKSLQADVMPLIVFVTAYDKYALDAFDVHAVDYILKPLDAMSLQRAVERCIERLENIAGSDGRKARVMGAINNIERPAAGSDPAEPSQRAAAGSADVPNKQKNQKIVVKDGGAITLIDQPDIDWVDAAGDYMCIHVGSVTHIMRSTMKSLLATLDPKLFKRIHRSTIVNLHRIQRVIPHTKGECFLELDRSERLKVSRNYRSVINDYLATIRD